MFLIHYSKFDFNHYHGYIGFIDDSICFLSLNDDGKKIGQFIQNYTFNNPDVIFKSDNLVNEQVISDLKKYFMGEKIDLSSIKTRYLIGSEFQQRVWDALKKIDYGSLASYKDIACLVNSPNAMRAVGMANKMNVIQLIVPCHRIINSNKTIGGYSSGIAIKKKLLSIENSINLIK